jgi:hypothetical protein
MSRAEERAREQWFKDADQVRFVPVGRLPEEVGVDTRMAVELPREPLFGERALGSGRLFMHSDVRAQRFADASRRSGNWHAEIERRLATLERLFAAAGDQETAAPTNEGD